MGSYGIHQKRGKSLAGEAGLIEHVARVIERNRRLAGGINRYLVIPAIMVLASLLMILLILPSADAATVTFKHIIVVIQENRSTDNLFGSNPTFEPGVDIATSGVNSKGVAIPLASTLLDYCYDLDHSHTDFVNAYDGGKMDGADKIPVTYTAGCVIPTNPQFKYVDNSTGTVQPYFDIATQYGWVTGCSRPRRARVSPRISFSLGALRPQTPPATCSSPKTRQAPAVAASRHRA